MRLGADRDPDRGNAAGRVGNERDKVAGIDDVVGRVVASDGVAGAAEEGREIEHLISQEPVRHGFRLTWSGPD